MTQPPQPPDPADQPPDESGASAPAQRNIDVGGGDYAEGNIDKRHGTFFEGTFYVTPAPDAPPDASAEPAPGDPPFKGLLSFGTADAALFYGRENLIAQCIGHLREQRFLAIIGASGSGKSSLVCAGVLPALKADAPLADGSHPPPHSADWPVHIITPTVHPLEALAASLTRSAERITATTTLIDDLRADKRALHLAVRKLVSGDRDAPDPSKRLLLFIDQFEELFTLCTDADERRAFVDTVLYAVDPQVAGPLTVIIALRADFYDECGQLANLREALAKQQLYIGAMSRDELQRAIELPAQRAGWEFEPGLVELMLNEVSDEHGALPLLSHALLETWRRRRGHTLTHAGYLASGGVRKAISTTAESVFGRLNAEQQAIARTIFLRLVEVSEVVTATRRRSTLRALSANAASATLVEAVLNLLADARLITVDEDTAEVSHEALLREWTTLRKWIEDERPSLRIQNRLTDAAQEWERFERDDGLLYRGARLDEALAWADTHAPMVNDLERAFLTAAQQAREREQIQRRQLMFLRRIGWAVAAVAILAVLLIGPGELAYRSYLRWQTARENPLVTLPGGEMIFGTDVAERDFGERATERRPVGQFAMETYEVTNDQYRRCVRAGGCAEAPRDTTFFLDSAYAQHPVVNVTAYQAATYCAWLGRRLPDEVEWERAARGLEGAAWPWGAEPLTLRLANTNGEGTMPVGSLPEGAAPGPLHDMVGNAWEWTSTALDVTETATVSRPWNGIDPVPLAVRGGAWDIEVVRISVVVPYPADGYAASIGFRCAQ